VLSPIEGAGRFWTVSPSIRIADVPAEVPDIQDRRADGRASIATDLTRAEALVAWVRYETQEFYVEETGETTRIYEPGTVNGGYGLEARDKPTVRAQLERTAIYARKVSFSGTLGPAVKISPPGINIEPAVAFFPPPATRPTASG
jgi:hypothetical protein